MTPELIKSYVAGGTVGERRVVVFHTTAGQVVQAAAATGLLLGVCYQPGGATVGQRCDVVLQGIADVVAGGTIAAGAKLTSDANGAVVAAAPAAGANNQIIGIALTAAAAGDIIPVLLAQSVLQG